MSKRTDLEREIADLEKLLARLNKALQRIKEDPAENAAPCYPYSPRAQRIMALHNGVNVDTMPDSFRWASNPHMQAWLDLIGAEMEAGRPHRDADGRWWVVTRIWNGEV